MGKSSGAAGVARLRAERNWAAAVWVAGPYAVGFVYSKSCARMTLAIEVVSRPTTQSCRCKNIVLYAIM